MSKLIQFSCTPEIKSVICDALRLYIDSAFPLQGCADCALVAREELLNAVKVIETNYRETGSAQYNKRIRAFVTEAVKLYFDACYADHPDKDYLCMLMVKLSRGDLLTNDETRALSEVLPAT